MTSTAANFTGSIPEYYDSRMGPAWFDKFAEELARRVPGRPQHGDALELACGTGILTARLRDRLQGGVKLVATDLSKAMLEHAKKKLAGKEIEWREADMTKLPFDDGSFGAVVCGFGFMFVPDRAAAFGEARRVLKEGGALVFSVWDKREENPHAVANGRVFEELFPGDAEMRYDLPYSMHDAALLRKLLAEHRFREIRIEKKKIAVVATAQSIAEGTIRGTPRSLLIEQRGVKIEEAIERLAGALAKVGGASPYRSHCQAVMVEARAI